MQTPPSMTRAQQVACTVGLTLLGLTLRLPGAFVPGLWRDEAECVAIAALPTAADVVRFLALEESHPPAFYVLLRLWQSLGLQSDSALVLLCTILGALQVPVAMALVGRSFGPRAAALAGLLVALSPPLIRYADQVRPYSLLPLLALLVIDNQLRLLRGDARPLRWIAYVLANTALLYTHHWAALFWIAQWVALLLILATPPDPPAALLRRALPWLAAQLAIAALWLPWLPTLRYQLAHAGHGAPGLAAHPIGRFLTRTPIATLAPLQQTLVLVMFASIPVIAALLLWRRWGRRASDRTALVPLAALLAVPFATYAGVLALSPIADLSQGRCNLPSRLLLLVGIVGLARVVRGPGGRARTLAAGVVTLGAVVVAAPWGLPATVGAPRTNAPALMERIAPDAFVFVAPSTLAPTVSRYLPPTATVTVYPNLPRTGTVSYADVARRDRDPAAYVAARALLRDVLARHKTVVFVTHHDNGVGAPDPEVLEIPDQPTLWHYGQWRAEQLAQYLQSLASPIESIAPPCRAGQDECLKALRFTSPG